MDYGGKALTTNASWWGHILYFMQQCHHNGPTLATNASWWVVFICFSRDTATDPHSHYKHESVGLYLYFMQQQTHPHYKHESVGHFLYIIHGI